MLDRNLTVKGGSQGHAQQQQPQQGQGLGLHPLVKAPLATPEPVEMPGDYAQVKVSTPSIYAVTRGVGCTGSPASVLCLQSQVGLNRISAIL